MASYTLAAGEPNVPAKTLVAATADTVSVQRQVDRGFIEIVNESTTSAISVRVDGTAPTADANTAYYVPPNTVKSIEVSGLKKYTAASPLLVKLISAGTPKYSVVVE